MTKLNGSMKRWIEEAIEHAPEPFTASQIYNRVIDSRTNNSHYISNQYSVGYYLKQICKSEKIGKMNMYWRKKDEN